MKAEEIKENGLYEARVSHRLVPVRVLEIHSVDRFHKRASYTVLNTVTKRRTVFRSAAKFRRPLVIYNFTRTFAGQTIPTERVRVVETVVKFLPDLKWSVALQLMTRAEGLSVDLGGETVTFKASKVE